MSDETIKKIEYSKELKVLVILVFSIFGFLFIDPKRLIIFAIISSLFLLLTAIYMLNNNLSISKHIFNLTISLFNVTSLIFMIQYFIGDETTTAIYKYAFYPFSKDNIIDIKFVIWIFILTLVILIIQNRSIGVKSER